MNTVNVDQQYKEVAWKFVNHCRGRYEFSEFTRIIGFYIALIKTGKLTSNTCLDYIYEQRLKLDHVNTITITINDVCHTLPQEYTIRQICEFVSKLPDLVTFFETIISMNALQAGRFQGEFIQPNEVTHLVTSLIENREINYVYNPFAGIASYQMDNKSVRYYSQELNYHTWLIGKIRLLLNDVDSDSYVCEDSIEKWQRIKFDAVISTPPFGGKIDQNRYYYTNGQNYTHREYESFYIDYALNSITLNGIVASVVSPGILLAELPR